MERPEITWDGVFWRVVLPDGEIVKSHDKSYIEVLLDCLDRINSPRYRWAAKVRPVRSK